MTAPSSPTPGDSAEVVLHALRAVSFADGPTVDQARDLVAALGEAGWVLVRADDVDTCTSVETRLGSTHRCTLPAGHADEMHTASAARWLW